MMNSHRIELNYAVYVPSRHGDYVTNRFGETRVNRCKHYFATRAEAVAFANGNPKLVMYRPGEAWKRSAQ
jgi:hypothetical protein